VVHHRAGWLNPVFEGLTYSGRLGLLWIALALVLFVLYRRWSVLAATVIAVAVADWSASGLKAVFDRERPSLRYAEPEPLVKTAHDASFPSGHAATSFAAATMLTFAFPRLGPALFLLASAVAFSRVYVGVHYPLDVIGGAFLGVLIAFAIRFVAQRALRLELFARSQQAGGDHRERRDQADEDPDPASAPPEELVRDDDQADQDEHRGQSSERDHDEALRDGGRQLDPRQSQRDEG
jgi:undecaprenyl-diphosphatase